MSFLEKLFRGPIGTVEEKEVGHSVTINSQSVRVLSRNNAGDVSKCSGTVTITDAGSGYAKGCQYVKTDAATGVDGNYRNVGTNTSCLFRAYDSIFEDIFVATTKKIQFRDAGLYIQSSIDGQLDIVADTTLALSGAVTMNSTLSLGGKLSLYAIGSAAASASGLLMGIGTTANPAASSTAGAIFAEFRTKSTATSGGSRGLYWRHEINGAGGGGECVRAFTKVTAAATTARGQHISLDLDAAGSLSGFGAGVDAQLMLGAAAYDDDITVQNLEIYGNTGATITGRTSFLRPVIQGHATAVADVNANAFFVDFSNVVASAVGLLDTDITALTGWAGLRVRCPDGVTRYIPITTGS